MNINDIMKVLFDWTPSEKECKGDALVWGDGKKDLKKVAVCCIATPDVINEAVKWGADGLITHEPTLFNNLSDTDKDPVVQAKRKLLENADLVINRFHDHSHFTDSDKIIEGVIKKLKWQGEFDGNKKFTFKEPKSYKDVIADIENELGLKHIRFTGYENKEIKSISMCVGSWGVDNVIAELRKDDIDAVICGEIVEWCICEYVRDAGQLGFKKSLFLLGHMGSEKSGMEYVCEYLTDNIPDVEFKYFDCKEVY